jgi:hypothetical protein
VPLQPAHTHAHADRCLFLDLLAGAVVEARRACRPSGGALLLHMLLLLLLLEEGCRGWCGVQVRALFEYIRHTPYDRRMMGAAGALMGALMAERIAIRSIRSMAYAIRHTPYAIRSSQGDFPTV